MSRCGSAARTMVHSGPPRWGAPHHGRASAARVSGVGAHRSPSARVFPQPARAGSLIQGRTLTCLDDAVSLNILTQINGWFSL
jgi:hypothetical protein